MKYNIILLFFCGLFLVSCGDEQANDEKKVESIQTEGQLSNADIIRNPISASDQTDTSNVAKISFVEESHDFGTVEEGKVVEYTFDFVNDGKIPLVINDARSTCGCTVPEWPQNPIMPGKKGQIHVKFNTEGRPNKQSKPITVNANTNPSKTVVYIEGVVTPKPE